LLCCAVHRVLRLCATDPIKVWCICYRSSPEHQSSRLCVLKNLSCPLWVCDVAIGDHGKLRRCDDLTREVVICLALVLLADSTTVHDQKVDARVFKCRQKWQNFSLILQTRARLDGERARYQLAHLSEHRLDGVGVFEHSSAGEN